MPTVQQATSQQQKIANEQNTFWDLAYYPLASLSCLLPSIILIMLITLYHPYHAYYSSLSCLLPLDHPYHAY